jgi:hypothetical protein
LHHNIHFESYRRSILDVTHLLAKRTFRQFWSCS